MRRKIRTAANRLTVVRVQCIFTLRFAHRVFRLTHVASNVAVCVVPDQKLSSLGIFEKKQNIQGKHVT